VTVLLTLAWSSVLKRCLKLSRKQGAKVKMSTTTSSTLMWDFPPLANGFFSSVGISRAQIEALMEGIMPGGPENPGARDAGAFNYLDQLLSSPIVYYEIDGWRGLYQHAVVMAANAATIKFPGKSLE